MLDEVNTCYPAKIESFDPVTQTCTATLSIEDYFTALDEGYTKQLAPLLIDIPVYSPQGSGWSITFPIKKGDDCLLLFAQKGYDQWLYSAAQETGLIDGIPTAEHYREYSLRDAMCLVGIRPIPSAIKDYSADDVDIRNADRTQRITLRANGDIELDTTTNVSVKANTVNVNATTTNVVSDNVKVQAKDAKVTADTAMVTCPNTKFMGNITVSGVVNCSGLSMGGAGKSAGVAEIIGTVNITGQTSMNGGLVASGDVISMGKSLSTHIHTGNMGSPTSPPL